MSTQKRAPRAPVHPKTALEGTRNAIPEPAAYTWRAGQLEARRDAQVTDELAKIRQEAARRVAQLEKAESEEYAEILRRAASRNAKVTPCDG